MPLYGPRQSREALPGQIGEKRRTTWPAFAGGDSGGRRTPKPEDHRCSGPAGIATCHRCHIGNRGPHVPYSIYIICTSSDLYFREQARVFFNEEKMAGLSCFAGVTRPGRFPDGNRCRVRGIPSFCTAANHFLRRWGQAGLTDPI